MDAILAAILDDDRPRVKKLLTADPILATQRVAKAKPYDSKIFHWLYVSDTALHLAAAGYRAAIVRILVEAGADPNVENRRGGRPLHYAADGYITGPAWDAKRQVETICRLLEAGVEVDAQDKNGASALHRAVRTRCADAVRRLLAAGANPKLKNKSGSTPFHLAVQNTGRGGSGAPQALAAQRRIIEQFLLLRVSPSLKDGSDKTVLSCARTEWIRRLLDARAST